MMTRNRVPNQEPEMPVFDYQCTKCGQVFESVNTRATDDDNCPTCGAVAKRVFHTSQNLKSVDFKAPPLARRHFGERYKRPPRRPRWQ
jgi:putative FmdB family regulatory protein